MLKNRNRIRCMFLFLFLSVLGVILPGCLRAVEFKFERWWIASETNCSKKSFYRYSTEGVIIRSDHRGVQSFRLEYRPLSNASFRHNHPEYVNTQLSVELQPRILPDDEQALIQQIRDRVPGVNPQEDPVARILDALSSPNIPAYVRREFISALAGPENARISGFGEAGETTVVGVSFLDDLAERLLIIKSKLPEDQFNLLVNAVVELRIPCFLPEAMAFHQFFPLVHFGESQNNNLIEGSPEEYQAQVNLYTDSAMSTVYPGRLSFRRYNRFYLELPDSYTGDVWTERPRFYWVPALSWLQALAAELSGAMPARPEPFERRSPQYFDSGYSSVSDAMPARPEPFERRSPQYFDSRYSSGSLFNSNRL